MLEAALELYDEQAFVPVPQLRLVRMPEAEAEYIGDLYETPKQRHPQEMSLAEIYAVKNAGPEDGFYAIRVHDDSKEPYPAFLSQARLITLPPGKREGIIVPIYGLNEVKLGPKVNLLDKTKAREAIIKRMNKSGRALSYV